MRKLLNIIAKSVLLGAVFFVFAGNVVASSGDNVTGYAWSSNYGAISFNCTNDDSCFGGYDPDGAGGLEGPGDPGPGDEGEGGAGGDGAFNTEAPKKNLAFLSPVKSFFNYILGVDMVPKAYADDIPFDLGDLAGGISYGVSVDPITGIMSGYAWSTNLGWVSFNGYGCPPEDDDGSCAPTVNLATGDVTGWAKVETATEGSTWDGWISLSCKNTSFSPWCSSYKVTYDSVTGNFSGYAWGSIVGAIRFSGDEYAVHVDLSQPTVTLGASDAEICPAESVTLEWNAVGDGLTCNAVSIPADPLFNGPIANAGSVVVTPLAATTYTISCTALGGDAAYQDTVSVAIGACGETDLILSAEPAPAQCTSAYRTDLTVYSPSNTTFMSCSPVTSIPAGPTYPVTGAPNAANGYMVVVPDVLAHTNPTVFQTTCYEPDATPLDMTDNPSMLVQTSVARACAAPRCDFTSASVSGEPLKATLAWTVSGASSLTASGGWSGPKSLVGGTQSGVSFSSPETTYTLTATNPDGATDTCSATLNKTNVDDPICDPDPNDPNGEECDVVASVELTADPTSLGEGGGSTVLEWSSSNIDSDTCVGYSWPTAAGWNGAKADDGMQSVAITTGTTFRVQCVDAYTDDIVTDDVTVTVDGTPPPPPPPPQCTDVVSCRTKPWYTER